MRLKLYVVRHGQTNWNAEGILQGHSDSPLTNTGIDASLATGRELINTHFTKIYCSDLGRTQETLQHIGLKGKLDPRLRERDYGSFAGKHYTEYHTIVAQSRKISPDFNKDCSSQPPGVETNDAMQKRWTDFLADLIGELYKEIASDDDTTLYNILLVTHGGMVRNIAAHLLTHSDIPLGMNVQKCGIGNNSISVFDVRLKGGEIVDCDFERVFDCKHLRQCL